MDAASSIAELQSEADRLRAEYQAEFGADVPDEQKSADLVRSETFDLNGAARKAEREGKRHSLITELLSVERRIAALQRS